MTYLNKIADLFQMTDEVWERHANPWSGWTRYLTLPLLLLAFWSRIWIGWWSIVPITILIIWTWLNPRVFPKPKSMNNWISKGVLGERIWIDSQHKDIVKHHQTTFNIINFIALGGGLICIWGLIKLLIWPTLFGGAIALLAKTWFIDRMVWVFEETQDKS